MPTASATPAPASTTPSPAAPAAGKVFALLNPGDSASTIQTFAGQDSVDGLSFRALWSVLEPSHGVYDWSSVDSVLSIAGSRNKLVTIEVGSGGIGTPRWLVGQGAQTYTYTAPIGTVTDPIPWDPVYIQQFNQFVAALGQHISASGKMSVVNAASVGVPVSEMTIVGCANGQLTGGTAYSRASYMNAWESTIAATAAAYPGKKVFVSLPISFICQGDGNDGKSFMTQLANTVRSNALISYFAADLNGTGSTRETQADSVLQAAIGINFQTIWSYSNNAQNRFQGSLSSAICYGWNVGARYFEIYQSDLLSTDPNVVAAIAQARTGAGCQQ